MARQTSCARPNVSAHIDTVVRSALLSGCSSQGFQYTIAEG